MFQNPFLGQAEYLIDIPDLPDQLHAVLVKAQAIAGSVITSIDPSKALQSPGVVAFFSAKDIPGENSFAVKKLAMPVVEELFCSGTVSNIKIYIYFIQLIHFLGTIFFSTSWHHSCNNSRKRLKWFFVSNRGNHSAYKKTVIYSSTGT